MAYIKKESYLHKKAKEVLIEWLKIGFDDLDTDSSRWHGDGIFIEYPLIDAIEYGNHNTAFNDFCGCDGRYQYYIGENDNFIVPSYEKCIAFGEIPIAILDVAIIYKGIIKCGFEIYHKNKVNNNKKTRLNTHFGKSSLTIYEINANSILKQIKKPNKILPYCKKI